MENKEIFLTEINIESVINIVNFQIPLSKEDRRHLILTGKNGSGKTTVLIAIKQFLDQVSNGQYNLYEQQLINLENTRNQVEQLSSQVAENDRRLILQKQQIDNIEKWFDRFGGVNLKFARDHELTNEAQSGKFLTAFFDSKRMTNLKIPSGINKVDLKTNYSPSEKANSVFIQYIVNLKAERSFARDDGEDEEVKRIDLWFKTFEERLQDIFEDTSLKLVFDRKNYNFKIETKERAPFSLTELSDGHSAIISIITELVLRMESIGSGNYKLPGIVLIDEIETHLHVDLQKKILPFLNDFFPNLQFIVTTHSPFVLQSISNSVVCDLQNRAIVEDLSGYSYDALIESYFGSDKYSRSIKDKLQRFEELSMVSQLNDSDREEYLFLEKYLHNTPKHYAPELEAKLQQIKLSKMDKD